MLLRKLLFTGVTAFLTCLSAQVSAGDSFITVSTMSIGASVSLGGTVVPFKAVTLSAQLPGRIESIGGEEGDRFEEGADLIAINIDDLQAKRRAAWANLANAEAALRNAGVQYSREWVSPYGGEANDAMGGMGSMMRNFTNPMQGMFGSGSPGYERHADLYQYGTRVEQARTQLVTARSNIEEIDSRIRDAKSLAPFNGVITRKYVEVGDTVQPGQPLIEYADISKLQIKVEVPARLMPGVKKGDIVDALLDVGNIKIKARVNQIFPIADADRHTVTVKLDLPPGAPGSAGMYAEVVLNDINAEVREMPVVPKSALIWRGSLPGVYIMNDQNKRELRLVRIGEDVKDDQVTILSGLRAGERLVVVGAEKSSSEWN